MGFQKLLVLVCLYNSISHAFDPSDQTQELHPRSHDRVYGSHHEDAYCATPTTYAMITPSPDANPYPVTRQGQEVTSYVPQYAVCNPDSSDCTTIYSTRTYNWCSTVVPCYQKSCTVTDCQQTVTFSHENSYRLQSTVCPTAGEYTIHGTATHVPSPTTVYYVQPIVTKYALSYLDYADNKYDNVEVEKCIEIYPGKAVCEVYVEHWVEEVREKDAIIVLPVTMHTYCPEPTTITCGADVVEIVNAPTTYTFVTESTETHTAWETETRKTSSITSTLTSTVTLFIPDPTVYPDTTTSCNTTYGPEPTPQYTTPAHHTTTITTDCPDSTIESTETQTLTQTSTVTIPTVEPSLTVLTLPPRGLNPRSHAEPSTSNYYPASPSPKGSTYRSYKPVKRPIYTYKKAGSEAGYKKEGSVHSYGQYADDSKQEEYSEAEYSKTRSGYAVKSRDVSMYEAAGSGKASGEAHSYGKYADHSEEYKYSKDGYSQEGPDYRKYTTVEPRDEYAYGESGSGKASGEVHSYGQYADHSEEYKYGKDGYSKDSPGYRRYEAVGKRDEYSHEVSGSGEASGEIHSYGQYADYSVEYEYSKDESLKEGVRYRRRKPVGARKDYEYEASSSGRSSGEVHSYGQYADHSEGYEHSQGESSQEEGGYRRYEPVTVKKASGEYGHEASGERHSYGQYVDYEKDAKYEYDSEGSRKGSKPGENSYSYGVEKEVESSYY